MTGIAIAALLQAAASRLQATGIEAPAREARLLLGAATGLTATRIMAYPEQPIEPAAAAGFQNLIDRRVAREPVSRILGTREFWSLDFTVTPATLDPRPDSETIVEAALDRIPDKGASIFLIDFGTGTGCLLLALLSERPHAWGIGIDRSEAAARVAADNARRLGLGDRARFVVGDWAAALAGSVDLIVANPPYIPIDDIPGLEPEVRAHDPLTALAGGIDGLDPYRILIPETARLLRPGGTVVFEVGQGQADAVAHLGTTAGLALHEQRRDLGGIARAIVLVKPT
ncbi:MAG TPA: peptide chain release factor N(5)-glutamine methyltransferase [Aliidongia sp.]|uniref:peptide chain release factor N(5)-glutamine methyltransferase n=1 Tax=Aliidongia sp. TaxID=1914230 RepID=UPI002DDD0E50|nr:peptide chain release factor N(5)-glutamine methyltransferase [Aliidongia sp.]HEV2674016.1 peptide chain release factor N(5)-glutamine methyltransferase [Aliidongia sp.]